MKKISFLLLAILISVTSCKKTNNPPAAASTDYNPGVGWTQSWSEEFNDASLNTSIWNYDLGNNNGWGNNELEYYLAQNVQLSNGNLEITAKRENQSGFSFTSGRINTQNKYAFKYGKIVAKMKLPQGYGIWPAFWMLGSTIATQPWPSCGEIDIMEMKGGSGGDQTIYSTCHWANSSNVHAYYGLSYSYTSSLSEAYHYYEVEWNATTITARFDGVQYYQLSITAPEASELSNNSYNIVLNLAVGGNFFIPAINNQANVTATFPQTMYVDWIKIYK